MDIFQKQGIREVADVTFYSIYEIGGEEYYIPVLHLDTLKISSMEGKVEKAEAKGGKGNQRLITWTFGKDVTLKLEDALFTPASLSMMLSGELKTSLTPYIMAILKIFTANKYGNANYSIKAFPSPEFTEQEWEIIFKSLTLLAKELQPEINSTNPISSHAILWTEEYEEQHDVEKIDENRIRVKKMYRNRTWNGEDIYGTSYSVNKNNDDPAITELIVPIIMNFIDNIKKLNSFSTSVEETENIDRLEKCVVTSDYGLTINTDKQKENIVKLLKGAKENFIIYYDPRTMRPFFDVTDDGDIIGVDSENRIQQEIDWMLAQNEHPVTEEQINLPKNIYDYNMDCKTDQKDFTLKKGTFYYKYSRTVKKKVSQQDAVLGKTYHINAGTFADTYRIVGETWTRAQKTGKDNHFQFIIKNARIAPTTDISMKADGDTSIFSMEIYAIAKDDGPMIELREYRTETDEMNGGTYIIPEKKFFSHTKVSLPIVQKVEIDNDEIY